MDDFGTGELGVDVFDDHVEGGVALFFPAAVVGEDVVAVVAPRDDDVGAPLEGGDVLVVRGLDELGVLGEDAGDGAAAELGVAEHAAGEAGVAVGLDEDLEVHELVEAELGPGVLVEGEDALEDDDVDVPERDVLGRAAAVVDVVVHGDLDLPAVAQVAQHVALELPVEGLGAVPVELARVRQLLRRQVAVEAVLRHDGHALVRQHRQDLLGHRRLAARAPARDPDHKRLAQRVRVRVLAKDARRHARPQHRKRRQAPR